MSGKAFIVISEHFLDEKGEEIFDQWFSSAMEDLKSYASCTSIRKLNVLGSEKRLITETSFSSFDDLLHWAHSEDHNKLMEQLSHHTKKPYYSFIYEA